MGFYSGREVAEQNPRDWYNDPPTIAEIRERMIRTPAGNAVDADFKHGEYVLSKRQADKYAPVLARINAGWHEGEGCSGSACCCDQTELEIE